MVILLLAACTNKPATNPDSIARYWSGNVTGVSQNGQELPNRDVGIIIIAGYTTGKVCGKFSEDDHCPGDIVLRKVAGNLYFISETVSGTRYARGGGDLRKIDLELHLDGTVDFAFHNGASITGILQRK